MSPEDKRNGRADELRQRLDELEQERQAVLAELCRLSKDERQHPAEHTALAATPAVTAASSSEVKIALFRSLFRGREDVFPRRWENARSGKSGYAPVCRNEWVRGVCEKPRVKCGECPHQEFVPVSNDIVRSHLQGRDVAAPGKQADYVAGVYPLLPDETCWFLAVDFDKSSWQSDASVFVATCRAHDVPVAVERSRSGNGAHVWVFFARAVRASEARRLGSLLLTATMEHRPDIGFESYDRFFPSQDTMPIGGFGNLIALPLQHGPRDEGNSVFVDDDFKPYDDQWAFLASIIRVTPSQLQSLTATASASGRIVGVRLPIDDEDAEPWTLPPSKSKVEDRIVKSDLPKRVKVVIANQLYIERRELAPSLVARCIRLAAFQNPEFYAAQAMRLPTYGKPRIISCAELFPGHIALPRGCLDELLALFDEYGIGTEWQDERYAGSELSVQFLGQLTEEQEQAAEALLAHDTGVLAAATAFGKTVVASRLMAERQRNTLVLVHRRQLMDQWIARLGAFLDIDPKDIGVIGGGRRKPTGHLDVALLQSVVRKGEVADLIEDYGQLVVDECHHLPAVSFEAVTRVAKAKYVLGLSATVTRKDGHHPIIFMQCGPVRYRVDARRHTESLPFAHKVVFRQTGFGPTEQRDDRVRIQELYGLIAHDETRNDMIFDDVLRALEAGRSPVVITERKDHLQKLADRLSKFAKNVIVLHGGMKAKAQRAADQSLQDVGDGEERVLLATGRYLGEGFDDARLDTLFLTMPISWRGLLSQYAGRLHRLHPDKCDVVIYDYVDANEPMLAKMAAKRRAGYHNLGYTEVSAEDISPGR